MSATDPNADAATASDSDLLRRYAEENSEAAFATLVSRHVDLVYSVARRQTGSASLAEDIAQSVFIELARQARRIQPGTPLVAWLHVVARRTAINTLRDTTRRQSRERIAVELAAMKNDLPSPAWSAIEPLLDEAVASLNEPDRAAILLRYFENKSLREIGAALGASEDAAQKRLSRALEQLRSSFARRGLALTTSGLVSDLSAHALQTAPASVSAAISIQLPLVGALLPQATAIHVTKLIAMATVRKSLIALSFATVVGVALYQTGEMFYHNEQLNAARAKTQNLQAQLRQIQRSISAARPAASTRSTISPPTDALEREMMAWLSRVEDLKELLRAMPQESTPEIALLSDEDWLDLVKQVDMTKAAQMPTVFREVRTRAKSHFALAMMDALKKQLADSDGVLPTDLEQLIPFFNLPVDETLLQRYEMTASGRLDARSADIYVVAEKSPVRKEDKRFVIGPRGYSNEDELLQISLNQAAEKFAAEHEGRHPTTPAEFQSYLSRADAAKLPLFFERILRDQQENFRRSLPYHQ